MLASPTLLVAHEGKSGSFVRWLEELGLGEFLRQYPLAQLVEWGWVVPRYRVVFPNRFFESWSNFPETPWDCPHNLKNYKRLWDSNWFIENDCDPHLFLDPALNTKEGMGKLLAKFRHSASQTNTPPAIDHARGYTISPYADYFYRWQGYALIEIIQLANMIPPIFATPDILERAQCVMRDAERISTHQLNRPQEILNLPQRWAGHAPLMTWLDHYRSMRNAIQAKFGDDFHAQRELLVKGAKALAAHFEITPEQLGTAIRDRLLGLAGSWIPGEKIDSRSLWTRRAWPMLQDDIRLAMSWLFQLTGKTVEDYQTEWTPSHMQYEGWLPLDEALPYSVLQHQKKFVQLAPHYLKPYNELEKVTRKYDGASLPALVSRLQIDNYAFTGFLAAFHELHSQLNSPSFDKTGIDFRNRRPLDHYSLLAIRAEGCLRRELDSLGKLKDGKTDSQGLARYIMKLSEMRSVSNKVTGYLSDKKRLGELTQLHKQQADPVSAIQAIKTGGTAMDDQLTQAFLCCMLARNYFAHHDYLDEDLLHSEKSGFMLRGILLTVLVLLDPDP